MTFASRTVALVSLVSAFLIMSALAIHAPQHGGERAPVVQPLPLIRTLAATATAYCVGAHTATGMPPRAGIIASDPTWLPTGSVVALAFADSAKAMYDGVYSVDRKSVV